MDTVNEIDYKKRIEALEQELLFEKQRSKVMSSAITLPFYTLSKEGVVVDCNNIFAHILKKEREEVLGFLLDDFLDKEEVDIFEKYNNKLIEDGGAMSYDCRFSSGFFKDEKIYFRKSVLFNSYSQQKEIINFISTAPFDAVNTDLQSPTAYISSRSNILKKELLSDKGFLQLIVISKDVFMRIDNQLKHSYVSPNISLLKGLEQKDYTDQEISRILYNDNIAAVFSQKVNKVFASKKSAEFTAQLKTINQTKILNFILVPEIEGEGVEESVVVLIRNITAQYQFEEELIRAKNSAYKANELKTRFLNNLSHEIRTPLNGIIGFAHLLRKDDLVQERREEYVDLLQQSCDRLLQMINNVVDISKIQTKTLQIFNIEFSLTSFLSELYEKAMEMLRQKGTMSIDVNIVNKVRKENNIILADKEKIEKAITHLISNAIKYTPEGFIEIGCIQKDASKLLFYVKDSGLGVSPEKHDIIFEEFLQVEVGNQPIYSGNGLGLAIAKGLVTIMGGTISCTSEVNSGATFYFTIPFASKQIQAIADKPEKENNPLVKFKGRNILIVEDDNINLRYLLEILSPCNFNTFIAEDGEHALSIFHSTPNLELILLDIQLPNISGYDVARQIRLTNQEIPVIAQTAHAMLDDRYKCLDVGCTDYITKPINRKLLFEMLSKYL